MPVTSPRLAADTSVLLRRTKSLSRSDLSRLMDISDTLADLNYHRFQALAGGLPETDSKPAILAFNGDVYRGLDASSLDQDELDWAQSHLRILSGLYGLLRPLDGIHPYRLEMGTRLNTRRGETLYDFWGDRISKLINEDLSGQQQVILNLASNEYFKAVKTSKLKAPVVSVDFREEKDGQSKVISFYAKYARGLMARWAIENRAESPEALKSFAVDGYTFQSDQSDDGKLVFSRPQPDPKA